MAAEVLEARFGHRSRAYSASRNQTYALAWDSVAMKVRLRAKHVTRSSITCPKRASRPSAAKPRRKLQYFGMLVVAEDGSGLTERSEKPGNDPIFGDGISPA